MPYFVFPSVLLLVILLFTKLLGQELNLHHKVHLLKAIIHPDDGWPYPQFSLNPERVSLLILTLNLALSFGLCLL